MAIEYHWEAFILGKRVKYHGSYSGSCMLEIKEDPLSLWVPILVYPCLQALYLMYCGELDLFILSSWNFVALLDIYLPHWNQLWHLKHSPALKGVQNDKDPFTNLTYIISEILKYQGKQFLLAQSIRRDTTVFSISIIVSLKYAFWRRGSRMLVQQNNAGCSPFYRINKKKFFWFFY